MRKQYRSQYGNGKSNGKLAGLDLQALHNTNLRTLLSAVWEHNPISRNDLSTITGLALSSITRLLQELMELGLVQETGKGESSGGRQPTFVVPNPDAGLVFSLDLSGPGIRGGIFNAANKLLYAVEQPFEGFGHEILTRQILGLIHTMMNHPAAEDRPILAIGVSQPGQIEISTGTVREACNLRLHDYPLNEILTEEFGLPVYIEHDASVAALTEQYYGAAQGKDFFVYILVSTGIGSGIITNGHIYRGETGKSGEFGHVIVEPDGALCVCGKRGCLEAVAAAPAILHSAGWIITHGRSEILENLCAGEPERLTIEMVGQAARMEDPVAKDILARSAQYLALGLSNYTALFDINFMLLGGEVSELGEVYLAPLRQYLSYYCRDGQKIEIIPAELKQINFLRGISMITLQEVIKLRVQNLKA